MQAKLIAGQKELELALAYLLNNFYNNAQDPWANVIFGWNYIE